MKNFPPSAAALAAVLCFQLATAQSSCSTTLTPTYSIQPSIASGYRMQLVATSLSRPRSIEFDDTGNLLVVEAGRGSLSIITLQEDGDCVSVSNTRTLVDNEGLNHGLALSSDGRTVYASSDENVWSWAYNSSSQTVSDQTTLIDNMAGPDHTTRTLLLSRIVPGMLLVSRGSDGNIDLAAASVTSGHSQIKAFNLNNRTDTYDFEEDGLRLGWGLRNSVGVGEHPVTGGIYSNENSADQIIRDGELVSEDNPGEELNFHGYLNGTQYAQQGSNYGYPWCFAAWKVSELPNNGHLEVGSQFALSTSMYPSRQNRTDAYCAAQTAPRLTFQAHMAPMDIKFNNSGTEGWITFRGSWDRTDPIGYKMSVIQFENGEPVDSATSTTALTDIFSNADLSVCPDNCFRPVGMAFDQRGRIFVASDASGEIYMITRAERASGTTSSGSSPSSTVPSSTVPSSTVPSSTVPASTTPVGAAHNLRPDSVLCGLLGMLVAIWTASFM